MSHTLTASRLRAMIPTSSQWTAKDFAFLVTILVHMCAIVWWGSKITSSVDNLAQITQSLQTGYVDLQVRMAVQEALTRRSERPLESQGQH